MNGRRLPIAYRPTRPNRFRFRTTLADRPDRFPDRLAVHAYLIAKSGLFPYSYRVNAGTLRLSSASGSRRAVGSLNRPIHPHPPAQSPRRLLFHRGATLFNPLCSRALRFRAFAFWDEYSVRTVEALALRQLSVGYPDGGGSDRLLVLPPFDAQSSPGSSMRGSAGATVCLIDHITSIAFGSARLSVPVGDLSA